MDYEKKIRDYMNSSEVDQLYKSMLSNLFPELVEPKEEKARRSLLEFLEDLFKLGKNINFDRWSKADCEEWVNWVMKQVEQKPAEWRITDEDMFRSAVWHIKNSISNGKPDTITKSDILDWFRNLKERVQPQSHWRPSEEQIKSLQESIGIVGELTPRGELLKELYEHLKKLL